MDFHVITTAGTELLMRVVGDQLGDHSAADPCPPTVDDPDSAAIQANVK